ncbi:MAG: hypothetical protein GWN62_22290, partial [Aliifodinibius sp.]|nr:hypothetical protein [Fodinibius sp.]
MSMRAITFAIICCGLFSLIAYSQTTFFKRTEANVNKAALGRTIPLEHALFLLSKAHQIHFIYEDKLIEGKTASHNVNITDSLYKDLQNVFDKHPIGYEKVGFRTFVLTSKSSPNSPSSIKEGIIQGKVTNRQGEAIPGADVFIPNTPWGSTADREGQFTIKNIPPANYTLTAQVIGYQSMTKEIYVTATESTTENFTLHLDVLNMDEVVTIASRNPLTKLES